MRDGADLILATIAGEFSDLRDVAEITRVTLRLLVAALLGAVLGIEREMSGKSAGVRTHMLICMGSAVFVMIPQLSGTDGDAMTRVIQGVVTGIGFLGAGAILKREDSGSISGLTTAAGIWVTAGVGVAAGLGREATAVLSTSIALATLLLGTAGLRWLGRRRGVHRGGRRGADESDPSAKADVLD